MGKIYLTESELSECIKNSVMRYLNEGLTTTWNNMKNAFNYVQSGRHDDPIVYISNGSNYILLKSGKSYSWDDINANRDDSSAYNDNSEFETSSEENVSRQDSSQGGPQDIDNGSMDNDSMNDESLGGGTGSNPQEDQREDNSGKLFKIGTGYKFQALTLNPYNNVKMTINGYTIKPGTPYNLERGQEIGINGYKFYIM